MIVIYPLSICYVVLAGLAVTSCSSPRTSINIPENTSVATDTGITEVVRPEMPFFDNMPNAIEAPRQAPDSLVYAHYEQEPEFPGGNRALHQFIEINLRMPSKANKAGVTGRVYVKFTVEATGEINDVEVLKGLGFGCDQEAVRLVESMPKWNPGKYFNKPVRVKYNLPILFESK